jgi:hypothetical protein
MTSADFVPTSSHVPESTITAEQIATRFNLEPAEGERVLLLALSELDRATTSAWRPVPLPTWEDWIIRTCAAVIAAKKVPTSGASQDTRADQGPPRPGGPRAYLAGLQGELANYVNLGFA